MSQVIWNSDIDVYDPKVIPILVARCISKYLCVQDLVIFGKVSKNTYKTVNDPQLWISKLKDLKCWDKAGLPLNETKLGKMDFSHLSNPLTCFDKTLKIPKAAKFQVLKIHQALYPYYTDLQLNKPYDQLRIFKDFQTPEEQSKILTNLLRYNNIDVYEDSSIMVKDKINSILEIFENALLRELEIHYDIQDYEKTNQFVKILINLGNQQTLIDFFLQKSIFDNEESKFFNFDAFDADSFYKLADDSGVSNSANDINDTNEETFTLNAERFNEFTEDLVDVFNEEVRIIDLIFPQSVPMMYKVSEELISNQLVELIMLIIDTARTKGTYLKTVPYLYDKLVNDFIPKLNPSENVGESYHRLILELIDMSFESFASEYMRDEILNFRNYVNENITNWNETITKRENDTSENIWKHVKVQTKNDFLTSFKKVFTINPASSQSKSEPENDKNDAENYSEIQAKAKILSENIKSLNKIFSPELSLDILNEAKVSLGRLLKFKEYTIAALKSDAYRFMQEIFLTVIDSIGGDHLRPGFIKALQYLQNYNPKDMTYINTPTESFIEPLVLFFDLINMADLIIQMIDIFYKEEMINRKAVKQENSILNPSLQSKKKLEGLVDKYVADGLNVGIDILIDEIEATFRNGLKEQDYNPPIDTSTIFDGPTKPARTAVKILEDNIDLLVGSADKSIVDVFQQEIAERFFQIIVKVLKRSTISVTGAINLISDLNLYYDFIVEHIKTNKKLVYPLFQSLKKVGSIYLISGSESKSIGKLVSDLSKFNGIFGQEEIYEFVQRRQDWPLIKRDVEKVMYGLSLGDCRIA